MKIGYERGAMGAVIDFPFTVLVTSQQGALQKQTVASLIKQGYGQKGLRFFGAGGLPYFKKTVLRCSYTGPILSHMPFYYGLCFKKNGFQPHPYLEKILTGLTWSIVQTIVETPLEQKRVHEVLQCTKTTFPSSFSKGNFLKHSYRGGLSSFYLSFLSWELFLTADHYLRSLAARRHPEGKITFPNQVLIGASLACLNVGVTAPLSMVRTAAMKDSSLSQWSYWQGVREIITKNGVKGLYRGWPLLLFRSFILSTIDSATLDYYQWQFNFLD